MRGYCPTLRSTLRALLAAVLGIAVGAGCRAPEGQPRPAAVLGRVGDASRPLATRPALEAQARRVGAQTRHAVPATLSGFEVDVPAEATALAFSTAVAGDAAGEALRFVVMLRSDASGAWRTLVEATEAGTQWRDHQVPLPAAAGPRTLRFAAGLAGSGREALWGSILTLGSRDPRISRPNILLVSLDTLGAGYLGAFSGRSDVSPRLDAFLAQGASFRRAFAQAGVTLVSHASLFSGLQPRRHGVFEGPVALLGSSLVEALAADGYRTAAFTEGGYVSAAFGFHLGFDAYDDGDLDLTGAEGGGSAETFARASAWIESHSKERFFVFLHSYEVHFPYLPRDDAALEVAARTTPDDGRVLSHRQQWGMWGSRLDEGGITPRNLARLRALYLGEVHTLDAAVGRLLARLDALGLAAQTLVVITADHGEQFGEWGRFGHGESLHNRVLNVPLGMRWPGAVPRVEIDAPVQLVDVMPTILELAGVPVLPGLDGRSLVPLLRDPSLPSRPAFSEQHLDVVDCALLGLPETRCASVDRVAVQDERFKLVSSRFPHYTRLYDLASDPLEERDVAAGWPEVVERLGALCDAHRAEGAAVPQGPPAAAPVGVDADTLQRLRDLGYLEAPDSEGLPKP